MKEVEFSEHALKRTEERGIRRDLAAEVIRNPDRTIGVKFGRIASYKKFDGDYVVVIYEEGVDKIVVVTILKVDKERLERYGFG